ncbi:hypothetical protein GW17_00013259 [Ensete ventricosum]|nr:hypothetical protein GW17_00013259 [Ensete ventricosum]RZR89543.1 hypothetical protein BHM03_00017296 [Ensete ventricosum]
MKKVGVFSVFLAIASFAALAVASLDTRASSSSSKELGLLREGDAGSGSRKGMEDKFVPRFDELRFI